MKYCWNLKNSFFVLLPLCQPWAIFYSNAASCQLPLTSSHPPTPMDSSILQIHEEYASAYYQLSNLFNFIKNASVNSRQVVSTCFPHKALICLTKDSRFLLFTFP